MRSTGIVRKVDGLGRVVIPKELRYTLDIEIKDPMEIFVDKERIILQKYSPATACAMTGEVNTDNITVANGNLTLSREAAEQILAEIEQKMG